MFTQTLKRIAVLLLLLFVLAVPALGDGETSATGEQDTYTMTITLVIPNAVPKLEATNATQTIKKGGTLQAITVTAVSGDWITWTSKDFPAGWTSSAADDTKSYTLTPPASPNFTLNGTHTYTVNARNDSGDTAQTVTITVKGSSVSGTNANGEFTGTRGTPTTTTDSSTGASTTSTTTTFTDTYSRQLLTADVVITAEATDFMGNVGVEFAHTFSVDVQLDLKDVDYKIYSYSLDVAGLPDWLTLGGEITSNDMNVANHHHEFTLKGTPSAAAEAVSLVFTATVKVSGDTPVLVALGSKDVKVSVGEADLVSIDAEISCPELSLDVGSTESVTAALTVKGKFTDGSTSNITDYTAEWSTASSDFAGITLADGVLSASSAAEVGTYNFPIRVLVTRGEFEASAEAVVKVTVRNIGNASSGISADSTDIRVKAGNSASVKVTLASGTNIVWSVTGDLPSGFTITSADNTLTISGTASESDAGKSFEVTVKASSTAGEDSVKITFTIVANDGSPVLPASSVNWNAAVGSAFSEAITATSETTIVWSYTGTLPSGLTATSADKTFTVSGTPSAGTAGEYSLTITAKNSKGEATATVTLTVSNSGGSGGSGDGSITATPGAPSTWTTSDGMSITGTQTVFTDGSGAALASIDIDITAASTDFVVNAGSAFSQVISVDVEVQILSTNYDTYSYDVEITGLPDWLKAEGETSYTAALEGSAYHHQFTLSGTPSSSAAKQNVVLTARVEISGGIEPLTATGSKDVNITVASETGEFVPELSITSASWDLRIGSAFSQTISITSESNVTWNCTETLPYGVSITSTDKTLTIAGTPAAGYAGIYNLTITAVNGAGSASANVTLTVADASNSGGYDYDSYDDGSSNSGGSNGNNANSNSGGSNGNNANSNSGENNGGDSSGDNSGSQPQPAPSTDYTPSNPNADVVVTPTGDAYAIANDGSLEILDSTSGNLSDVLDQLTPTQKASITSIKVNNSITDLSGLSGLTNLEELDLSEALSLTVADLSGNTSIKTLNIEGNTTITTLNLSGSAVETVNARDCGNITEINLEGCENLTTVDVSSTNIFQLNAEDCANLETLHSENCTITTLNISNCQKLKVLDFNRNKITHFRVKNMPLLNTLLCSNQTIDAKKGKNSFSTPVSMSLVDLFNLSGRNTPDSPLSLRLSILYRTASAAEEQDTSDTDYGFEYVSNVKAWDDDGQEITTAYNHQTGEIVFSGDPAKLSYEFDTGFQGIKMDVSVFIPAGDETPDEETPTPGGDSPNGETPSNETPSNETPNGETPTPDGDTPNGETPSNEPPSNETPGDNDPGSSGGGCDAFGAMSLSLALGLFLTKKR